ncbi:MAG: hypothetical protein ACI9HK_006281 [Pirellulaceae bacterium]|jgi:hypothetical protein
MSPRVKMHSIIGRGTWLIEGGDSDGVVAVSSATVQCASSELLVDAKQVEIHKSERGIAELIRILKEHSAALRFGRIGSP